MTVRESKQIDPETGEHRDSVLHVLLGRYLERRWPAAEEATRLFVPLGGSVAGKRRRSSMNSSPQVARTELITGTEDPDQDRAGTRRRIVLDNGHFTAEEILVDEPDLFRYIVWATRTTPD